MAKCKICSKEEGTYTITESRYFHGEGKICKECFDLWCDADYSELDDLAEEKIRK
jgi:hypothetical protein